MTTADPSWLSYWQLNRDERRIVRRIARTCRAVGDPRLDALAHARLARAARRHGVLGRLLQRRDRPAPDERLDRLDCTMRHPSRTRLEPSGTPVDPCVTRSSRAAGLQARRS